MSLRKMTCLLVVASVSVFGCAKQIDMEQSEIAQRKVLVMVAGEPKSYVWSMGGTMGAAVAFGLIGTAAAAAVATEKGKKFDEAMVDYPHNIKLRDSIVSSLKETADMEVIPVCFEGEDPEGSGCAVVPDEAALKSDYAGQLLLAAVPCEYGLRNQVPYFAVNVGYFDIDSGKAVWRYGFSLKNEEIPQAPRDLGQWISDKEEACNCLDCQINELGKRISQNVITGEVPEEEAVWVYMGCSSVKANSCFETE